MRLVSVGLHSQYTIGQIVHEFTHPVRVHDTIIAHKSGTLSPSPAYIGFVHARFRSPEGYQKLFAAQPLYANGVTNLRLPPDGLTLPSGAKLIISPNPAVWLSESNYQNLEVTYNILYG